MRRRIAAGAAAVAMVAAAAGCAPDHGEVIRKGHSDAYVYYTQSCASYNSNGGCSAWMPHPNYVPESWELCLRDDNDPQHTGCLDVDDATWRRYEVGQHYPDAR